MFSMIHRLVNCRRRTRSKNHQRGQLVGASGERRSRALTGRQEGRAQQRRQTGLERHLCPTRAPERFSVLIFDQT
jgi:hypothetical protein